ncbi:phage holin family protein [Oscillibacter ruminantium]|uniref:phage holin family protein n=1 Tax=Oscillibacter ruminantium TaxID=1263547 RepID=UPI0002D35C8D|nr:phage holin family protein [Oscillibacter ruminantium]
MDMTSFGIASVAAITVICYLVGLVVKVSPWSNDKYIPIACGVVGGVLGIVALYTGLPQFPATDPLTAVSVGIVSGLAATGINQAVKQLGGGGNG